jgi:hypothetical protein
VRPVVEFEVLIRSSSTNKLHGVGVHTFARLLVEGEQVNFQGATWKVVRVHADRSPKVVVLELQVV